MASDLRGIIDASVSKIRIDHFGRFPSLELRERVFLLIIKEMYRQSNRREAYLLPLMGLDKHIGYKSVERLYSDPLVIMVLCTICFFYHCRKEVLWRSIPVATEPVTHYP